MSSGIYNLTDDVNNERESLGLRRGGDPMLDERSARWKEEVQGKIMEYTLRRDMLIQKYGTNHARAHPEHWIEHQAEFKADERDINEHFLTRG